jgi:hypothetical protein
MRASTVVATIGVVILAAGAAGVRYVALPAVHQLPSTVDTTVTLTGTMDLFDEAALRSGNAAGVIKPKVPVTVTQHVKVVSTSGATAVVSDETTTTGPGSTTILSSKNTWAIDRTELSAATAPGGVTVTPHDGLVVGFPLTPEPKDYPYWDTTTQTTATAQYRRAEAHAGRDSYVYEVSVGGPVKDPAVLALVPAALPKQALLVLAASLGPQVQQMLAGLGDLLPAQIPLTYKVSGTMTFWVDTATGYVLDVHRQQTISADLPTGLDQLNLPTKFTLDVAYTPDTVNAASADAATAATALFRIGTLAPLVLGGLAVLLLLVTLLAGLRRRARRSPPEGPSADAPTDAGSAVAASS